MAETIVRRSGKTLSHREIGIKQGQVGGKLHGTSLATGAPVWLRTWFRHGLDDIPCHPANVAACTAAIINIELDNIATQLPADRGHRLSVRRGFTLDVLKFLGNIENDITSSCRE